MKYLPKNTLAYWMAAPQVHRHDLSEIPVSAFSAATKKYRESCGLSQPTKDAVTFYALNHCTALVKKSFTKNEPLPSWAMPVLESYSKVCNEQGKRMLHYILSICTREMRHLGQYTHMTPAKWKQIEKAGGPGMVDFIKQVMNSQDSATSGAVQLYMDGKAKATIGQYIKAMSVGFKDTGWNTTSYGGPQWGTVSDAAVEMIYGNTSMEMLVDNGYTLAHNGGPIFNKDMMYHTPNADTLLRILDVQKSGQIPELIMDPADYDVEKTPEAKQAVKLVIESGIEHKLKGYVDWYLVTAMGAIGGDYADFKIQQKKAHPELSAVKAKAVAKMLNGKKVMVTGTYHVFPGQSCEILTRVG